MRFQQCIRGLGAHGRQRGVGWGGVGRDVRPVSQRVPVLFSFNAVLYTFDSTA